MDPVRLTPTVMVAHQSLPGRSTAQSSAAATTAATVASLGSGSSGLPASSMKLTLTLIFLSTSVATGV